MRVSLEHNFDTIKQRVLKESEISFSAEELVKVCQLNDLELVKSNLKMLDQNTELDQKHWGTIVCECKLEIIREILTVGFFHLLLAIFFVGPISFISHLFQKGFSTC